MRLAKINSEFNQDKEIERVKSQMEKNKQEFIQSIPNFIKDWYTNQYKRYTDMLSVSYENLSDEEKSELDSLIDNLIFEKKQLAVDYFNNNNLWYHLDNQEKDYNYYKTIDNLIDDEFRFLLGSIGEVLNDFGFIPKYFDRPVLGLQCQKDNMNIYRFKYCDPIFWSREMKTAMDNYWENYKYIINLKNDNIDKKSA